MAINFPTSPTDGQVYSGYYYDETKTAWRSLPLEQTQSIASSTPPLTANPGELWFNTNDGVLLTYFDDGTSAQWVEMKANSTLNSTIPTRLDSLEASRTSMLATDISLLSTQTAINAGTQNIPGAVLQVVQGVLTTTVSFTTANSWTSVGISASITPKFSTSKILVSVHVGIGSNAAGDQYDSAFGLFRNGTQIALPAANSQLSSFLPFGVRGLSQYEMTTVSNSYLDSPATTSSMTYDVRAFSTNSNVKYINRTGSDATGNGDNRMISTITLMEVAQ